MIGNYLHLSDAEFVDDLYREWLRDSGSIDPDWAAYFRRLQDGLLDEALEGTVDISANGHVKVDELRSTGIMDIADPETGARRLSDGIENEQSHIDKDSHAYKQSRVNALIWAFPRCWLSLCFPQPPGGLYYPRPLVHDVRR